MMQESAAIISKPSASRKQLLFKKWLYTENCLRKYSFFFQNPFSEIISNPAFPPSQPLDSWAMKYFLEVNMPFIDTKKS